VQHILSCKGDPFPGYSPLHWKREERRKNDEIGLFLQYRGRKLPLLPDPGIAFGGREITGLKKILVVYISHTI
jgi:hypothetical protein